MSIIKNKIIALCIAAVLVLAFAACGSPQSGSDSGQSSPGSAHSPAPQDANPNRPAWLDEQPNLVDHGDSVSITFPAEMFEGVDLSPEFIEVNDYIAAVKNADDTVTITMSKALQENFMNSFRGDVDYNIDYFISEVGYLTKITYTDDMRSMQLYVEDYDNDDLLIQLLYFFCYPFEQYQFMLGQNVYFVMTVIDGKTGEVVTELAYPDDLM